MTGTDAINDHHRPAAPKPSDDQSRLIESLGGPQAVANLIRARLGIRISRQAVSVWSQRGIPYRYRAALAIEARERELGVPPNFLGEGEVH